MTLYLIHFNQQWVGDHDEEWFRSRGSLANAVVEDMVAAGVCVVAGGLVEDLTQAFSADARSGTVVITDGPYTHRREYLGGLTLIDVPDVEQAKLWAGRVAEACGWPQEVRELV